MWVTTFFDILFSMPGGDKIKVSLFLLVVLLVLLVMPAMLLWDLFKINKRGKEKERKYKELKELRKRRGIGRDAVDEREVKIHFLSEEEKHLNDKMWKHVKLLFTALALGGLFFFCAYPEVSEVLTMTYTVVSGELSSDAEQKEQVTEKMTESPETDSGTNSSDTTSDAAAGTFSDSGMTFQLPETEKKYNPESTMNISSVTESTEISAEYSEAILFSLLPAAIMDMTEDELYSEVEMRLLYIIDPPNERSENGKKRNKLESASPDYQQKVLDITNKNDAFYAEIWAVKDNSDSTIRPGSETWYKLLPKGSDLIAIINEQEVFMQEQEDIHFAQQLQDNHSTLAKEYLRQRYEVEYIHYHYTCAAYYAIEKLKFENITMDNCYKTLENLCSIYEAMDSYTKDDSSSQSCYGKLVVAVNKFIEQDLRVKEYWNDPIEKENRNS